MSSLARYDRSKARYDATSLVILTVDISTKETGVYLLIVNDWWFGCGRMDLGIDVKLRLGYGLSFYLISMAFRGGCNGLLAVHVLSSIRTWPCFGALIALGQP